jgi:tRNA nucleotidyltransferase (CCA-adding enzyme)
VTLSAQELTSLGFRHVIAKSTLPIYFRPLPDGSVVEVVQLDALSSLDQDLQRRDFTINAMALTLTGELLDPCNGHEDLSIGRIQVCSASVFHDDPLRLIRALRFAAEGWQLSSETLALMAQHAADPALATVPIERFSREMLKALQARDPARFFRQMVDSAAGECFLPELFCMPQIPAGPLNHHPEGDLLTHSLQALERMTTLTADPMARFCALFHDLGKLVTEPALYPRHLGHEGAGHALAIQLCDRLRLPTNYRTSLAAVCRLHGTAHRWAELRTSTRLRLAEQARKAGIVVILPLMAAADKAQPTVLDDWDFTCAVAGMSASDLGISVEQLSHLHGPLRGALLTEKKVALLRGALATGAK